MAELKSRLNKLHPAKSQNMLAAPALLSSQGTNCPTIATAIHNISVHIATARARTSVGNISFIITQVMGPNENAKQAMNNNINTNNQGPCVCPV